MKRALPHPSVQPTLHSLLQQANREATSELRRLAGSKGVPVEFWRVLEVMVDEQARSMSALAQATGMQMPAMSKLIDRMVDAALVQRSLDPTDHRRLVLYISDFGLQKVTVLRDDMERRDQRLAKTLTRKRELQLRELLQDFIRAHRQETG